MISPWRGKLDVVNRGWIAGWAYDEVTPARRVKLRLMDNGVPLAEVLADAHRADLEAAAIGDGCHAFAWPIPGGLAPDKRHLIEVLRSEDGAPLPGSPWVIEAMATASMALEAGGPAAWRGQLELVTRSRIAGWAFDPDEPETRLALTVMCNGDVLAQVLANRFRPDLLEAGLGDGRHAFGLLITAPLSPLSRQVIQVVADRDGCELPGSPVTLEPSGSFDAALEHAVSQAVGGLSSSAERARVFEFLAAQTDRLLQSDADAASGREARLIQREYLRRMGSLQDPAAASMPPLKRALIIDDRLPVSARDAGSAAIVSHARALQVLGYEVSFAASQELSAPPAARAVLEELGVTVWRAPFYASVEEVLRRQADGFELVYLHRISNASQYLALVRAHCPRARTLYAVADLHHVRVARQAKVESRPELTATSQRLRMEESMAAAVAGAVVTHSPFEAEWLGQLVRGCNVHVVPWEVGPRPTSPAWQERRGVAFVGDVGHAPNRDAVQCLIEHIIPRWRREDSTLECLVVGGDMPVSMRRLQVPGFTPVSGAPALDGVFDRVRLTVAPLRYGAGINAEVLESLAAGVPCVMSPVAAEGLRLPAGLRSLVAADADRLAARTLELYVNESEWRALAQAGLEFIATHHNAETVVGALRAAILGRRDAQPQPAKPARIDTPTVPSV